MQARLTSIERGVVEIETWNAKLSQLDHTTGDCVKKPLSLRRHAMRDRSRIVVQRDVYSAFLALHCSAEGWSIFPDIRRTVARRPNTAASRIGSR